MNRRRDLLAAAVLLISGLIACGGGSTSTPPPIGTPPPTTFQETSPDASGSLETFSQTQVDQTNPFFIALGTNQRTCNSCHVAADGWSINPTDLQQRFQSTQGTDPVFRAIDGANCPSSDVSTFAAATASYSQLLNFGLIRITLPVPANAEFSIISINDPYQCPETTATQPALSAAAAPSTNLKFLNGIMWDGREPDLKTQALDATTVHTQPSTPPNPFAVDHAQRHRSHRDRVIGVHDVDEGAHHAVGRAAPNRGVRHDDLIVQQLHAATVC